LRDERKTSVRLRNKQLLTVGLLCVVIGAVLIVFATFWRPSVPPVDLVLGQSGVKVLNGVYFDLITVRNNSTHDVGVIVEVKTVLDGSPRVSDPVILCGQCQSTVRIQEVQPTQGMNLDYYQGALATPEYIQLRYAPTILSSFASSALPLGLGAVTPGVALLLYRRTSIQ
jgi:hypothetical protein